MFIFTNILLILIRKIPYVYNSVIQQFCIKSWENKLQTPIIYDKINNTYITAVRKEY